MHMLFVRNILLVEVIHLHLFLAMGGPEQKKEVFLELVGVVVDVFLWVFADEEHAADVRFGLGVHFETVFIAHLALADLGAC